MNNPTYLQLCLNDFVISRSSIHEFETCKDYIFLRRKSRFKKKMVGKITKMCTLKIFIGEFICHVYK